MIRTKNIVVGGVFSLLLLLGVVSLRAPSVVHAAATITVNSTADDIANDGECTLREAIIAANTDDPSGVAAGECISGDGDDTIAFNITGTADYQVSDQGSVLRNGYTIIPATPMPVIETNMTINGYSQPFAQVNTIAAPAATNSTLLVQMDGTSLGLTAGLTIGNTATTTLIRGLNFTNFDRAAILADESVGATIQGNSIHDNAGTGIVVSGATTTQVGGSTPSLRNTISTNDESGLVVQLASAATTIQGNRLIDNTGLGIEVNASTNTTVGGTASGQRNYVSGNSNAGVYIHASAATATVTGNTLTDNTLAGLAISSATGIVVGGTATGAGNTITLNQTGVEIGDSASGITLTGNTVANNTGNGISVSESTDVTMGGTATGAANTVQDNSSQGILISDSTSSPVINNIISGNGASGISVATGSSDITVQGNSIEDNSANGVVFNASSASLVGGTQAGQSNTITLNGVTGVQVSASSTDITIQGNSIEDNTGSGVAFTASSDSMVDANDIISNTQQGINITSGSSDITIQDNAVNDNGQNGVQSAASSNIFTISNALSGNGKNGVSYGTGLTSVVTGNQIEDNTESAILLNLTQDVEISDNVLTGNVNLGINLNTVDATTVIGNTITGNSSQGVGIINSTATTVGGTSTGTRNVINDNAGTANITITGFGGTSSNTIIQGNYIGVSAAGAIDTNFTQGMGVYITADTQDTTIGGVTAAAANIIAGGTGPGVAVEEDEAPGLAIVLSPSKVSILGNKIYNNSVGSIGGFANSGLGIDLFSMEFDDTLTPTGITGASITPNDASDADTGPNNYMNFPVISSAQQNKAAFKVTYNLDAADSTNANYRVEFFANDAADLSGNGEGQTYLGSVTAGNGNGLTANLTLPSGFNMTGKVLSATTTAINNSGFGATSEFSATVQPQVLAEQADQGLLEQLGTTGQDSRFQVLAAVTLLGAAIRIYKRRVGRQYRLRA